ncbi:cupin fold metalloprotein, WbuC family [Pseudodesulfovibrio sp. JC047]|uniref:WbuC family cupin fold metalloprotein n=1 Tax=Pseudodesulfovibrio sp. JC047 TaxID=2683199 RepID=UPI0013D2F947|nr:WbuC family cupin fold metalloprotein [Pseudodesulfovibrio sp. JC047]NDV20457.1 cupin fold metalloprotein, WbuC family [Pseudodesulfovibrio sp. JC047]
MTHKSTDVPVAMDAPEGAVTPLSLTMVGDLLARSRDSARKRMLQKLHSSHDALSHRMFNAMQPGTYIMPHRHLDPPKDETVLVMAGSVLFIQFSDAGDIEKTLLLQPGTENFGIDVAPHVYHTYIPLKQDTLIFETKTGPYTQEHDKNVPDWAPREGSPEAEPYLLNMIKSLAEQANAAVDQVAAKEEDSA